MPWHVDKRDGSFCVIKDDDGESEGCHDTREKAERQMAALYASEERRQAMPAEIEKAQVVEVRSSTVTDVNSKQRLIDVIAVPWEQEAEVPWQGEIWREVFVRGAFDGIEDHAGRIRVNREHQYGDTIGKVVQFTNADNGLLARVKVAETERGDETLSLAEEDMISASVAYRVKKPSDVQFNRRIRLRRVVRAFIDHLAMVESPAYAGAQVLAVRAEPSGLQVVEQKKLPIAPALEDFANDPVLAWARDRVKSRES